MLKRELEILLKDALLAIRDLEKENTNYKARNEKTYPSLPALVQIAKTLNVSTDYLLGLTSGKIEESIPKEQNDEEI